MAFPIGQNAGGKPKLKEFREALRKALNEYADDEIELPKKPKRIDVIAMRLVQEATEGDNPVPAIKEIADRLDGKPSQAIVGDDAQDPIRTVLSWATQNANE